MRYTGEARPVARFIGVMHHGCMNLNQVIEAVARVRENQELVALGSHENLLKWLRELKELREQVGRVQARCNELLAMRRGIRYLVSDFHAKFGYPVNATPYVPDDETVRFRLALITEEFFELVEATTSAGQSLRFLQLRDELRRLILRELEVDVDLPEAADAMTDIDYVIEGTRLTLGIDGWAVLQEVQRANMDKVPSELHQADAAKVSMNVAKAKKPADWRPPDIAGVLARQGWVPDDRKFPGEDSSVSLEAISKAEIGLQQLEQGRGVDNESVRHTLRASKRLWEAIRSRAEVVVNVARDGCMAPHGCMAPLCGRGCEFMRCELDCHDGEVAIRQERCSGCHRGCDCPVCELEAALGELQQLEEEADQVSGS